jgi:hypothetical protein
MTDPSAPSLSSLSGALPPITQANPPVNQQRTLRSAGQQQQYFVLDHSGQAAQHSGNYQTDAYTRRQPSQKSDSTGSEMSIHAERHGASDEEDVQSKIAAEESKRLAAMNNGERCPPPDYNPMNKSDNDGTNVDGVDAKTLGEILQVYDRLRLRGAFPVTCTTSNITSTSHEPPIFHGRESENAEDWFSYLTKYATYKRMNDDALTRYLPLLLQDAASDWYDGLEAAVKSSWQQLKTSFLRQFASRDVAKLRDAASLWNRVQKSNESVAEYFAAMKKLAKYLPIHDEMLQYAILNGFLPAVKAQVVQSRYPTMDDLLEVAKRAEIAQQTMRPSDPLLQTILEETLANRRIAQQNQQECRNLTHALATNDGPSFPRPQYRRQFQDRQTATNAPPNMQARQPMRNFPQTDRTTWRSQPPRPTSQYGNGPVWRPPLPPASQQQRPQ